MLYSWMRRVCKTTPLSLGRNGGGGTEYTYRNGEGTEVARERGKGDGREGSLSEFD